MARREERAYLAYVSDEQRSQAGCIGGQDRAVISGRALSIGGILLDRPDCLTTDDKRLSAGRMPFPAIIHRTDGP